MILCERRSERQAIRLLRLPDLGLCLDLDGARQFAERFEHRYHEGLAVVPMLYVAARRVFVGGGGDGLAARRLLGFPGVERVVVCDYDEEVTRLAREDPDLSALNHRSLSDPRVELVHHDAFEHLGATAETYDLVLCDFPDALGDPIARLYSVEMYRRVASRLSPGGAVVVQTCPHEAPTAIVRRTLEEVFEHVAYYGVDVRHRGYHGFTIASARPLRRSGRVPGWTRYLTDELADAIFVRPKDEASLHAARPNTLDDPVLAAATVAAMFRGRLARPYAYDPTAVVVVIGAGSGVDPAIALDFVRYTEGAERVIAYVDAEAAQGASAELESRGYRVRSRFGRLELGGGATDLARLDRLFSRIDDGSIAEVEAQHCAAAAEPEVRELFAQYLATSGPVFFDGPPDEAIMQRPALYLLFRAPSGRAVALMRVRVEATAEIEAVFGRGTHRQHALSILLGLKYLATTYRRPVTGMATPRLAPAYERAGAKLVAWYDVLCRP